MLRRTLLLPALAGIVFAAPALAADNLLAPQGDVGDQFANVFSRTVDVKVTGFDEAVSRVSGTASYHLASAAGGETVYEGTAIMDGRPAENFSVKSKDAHVTVCSSAGCQPATDASGPLADPRLWGQPFGILHRGTNWDVAIEQPWELGPAATQKVTVIRADLGSRTVTLLREGNGSGAFADDRKEIKLTRDGKTYAMKVQPGEAHWRGYATFTRGMTESDELVVERTITVSGEPGTFTGTERQYILMNAAPASAA